MYTNLLNYLLKKTLFDELPKTIGEQGSKINKKNGLF